jgi:hypothetical protein
MYKYTEWEDIKKSGLAEEYLIFDKQFETMNIIRSLQKKISMMAMILVVHVM